MSIRSIVLRSAFLRMTMRKTFYCLKKIRYSIHGLFIRPDAKVIVLCSYSGKSFSCSPKAIYEYMTSCNAYDDYTFVWIFDNPDQYRSLCENHSTFLVKKDSAECERYLHRAGLWIFNFRAPDHWTPQKDQEYIQCWHGTPLKKLGYDITASDNAMNSVKEIQYKYRSDAERFKYLLSPCRFATEKFTSAWNLDAPERTILELGYPRNDFLSNYTEDDAHRIKKSLGIDGCRKKLILYAPTWRDNQFDSKQGYVYHNPVDFRFLMNELDEEYAILFRAHYMVADNFDFEEYEGFIYDVSGYDDINELYIISDLLITDYSSVFFDYAILKRPIIFFMYDMEKYRDEIRGFYLNIDELPGAVVKTERELLDILRNKKSCDDNKEKLEMFNQKYNAKNDGSASARVVKRIIG